MKIEVYYLHIINMRKVIIEDEPEPVKKQLGQYFTRHPSLQQWVFDHVRHRKSRVLEPSFGAGHLLVPFLQADPHYPITCVELDASIAPVVSFTEHQHVHHQDFTQWKCQDRFKTIVGNPPYVKQRTGNLYLTFIQRCLDLLEDDGELIFIIPSDFFKLTRAAPLLERMTREGSFTNVYYPHDENLFEDASIDVMLFRYERGCAGASTLVNGQEKIYQVQNGILTFYDQVPTGIPVEQVFDVAVGLVSGKDEVFGGYGRDGNINFLVDQDKTKSFLYLDQFPCPDERINSYLLSHKEALMNRKIKSFTEKNWFEWGAPRNKKKMEERIGTPCIYVKTLTRNGTVAFVSTVQYFGGSLLCLFPKTILGMDTLKRIVDHLNSDEVRKSHLYSERFKMGHKQLANVILPLDLKILDEK